MNRRFRLSTALDVDDLLMECVPYAIRLANEKYKFDPPLTIYEVDRWGTLGTRADVIFEFFTEEFFRNQPVIKGAKEFVRKLSKMTEVFHLRLPGVHVHPRPADHGGIPGDPQGSHLYGLPEG